MLNFKEFVNMQELDYFAFIDLLLGWFDEYKMDVDTLGHRNRPEQFFNITKQEELTEEEYEELIKQGHFSLNSRTRSEYTVQNIRLIDVETEDFDLVLIQELQNDKIGYVYRDDFSSTAIWKHRSTTLLAINDLNEYVAYTYEGDHFAKTEEDLFGLDTSANLAKGNKEKYFIPKTKIRTSNLDLKYFIDPQVAVFNPRRLIKDMIKFFDGYKLNNELEYHAGSIIDTRNAGYREEEKYYQDLVEILLYAFVQLKPLGKMQSGPRLEESLETSKELSDVDLELIAGLGYDTVVLFEEIQEGIAGRIFQVMQDMSEDNLLAGSTYEEARFFLYDDNSKKKHSIIFKEKHNTWRYKAGFVNMEDLNSPTAPYNRGQDILERNDKKKQNVAFLNTFVFMTYEGEGKEELMKLASKLETDAGVFVGNYMFTVFNSMNRTKGEMRKQFDTINKVFDTDLWNIYIDSLNPLDNTLMDFQKPSYYAERNNFIQDSAELIAYQEDLLSEYIGNANAELRMESIRKILEYTFSDEDYKKYEKHYKREHLHNPKLMPTDILSTYYYLLNIYINQELEAIDDRDDFDEVAVIEKTNKMVWTLFESTKKLDGVDIYDIDTFDPKEAALLNDFTFFNAGKTPSMLFNQAKRSEILALAEVLEPEELEAFVERFVNIQLVLGDPHHELSLEFYRPIHDFLKSLDTQVIVSQKTEAWSSTPRNVKRSRISQSLSLEEYDMLARIKPSYQSYDRLDYLHLPLNLTDPVLLREHGIEKALRQYSRFSETMLDKEYKQFWYQSDKVEDEFKRYKKDVDEPFVVDEVNVLHMNRVTQPQEVMEKLDSIIQETMTNKDGSVKTPKIETMKRSSLEDFVYLGYNDELAPFREELLATYIYYVVVTGDALLDIEFDEFMKNGIVFLTAIRRLSRYVAEYAKVRHFVPSTPDDYNHNITTKLTSDGAIKIKEYYNQVYNHYMNKDASSRVSLDADDSWEVEYITDGADLARSLIQSEVSMDKKLWIANHVATFLLQNGLDVDSEMLVKLRPVIKFTDSNTGKVVDFEIPDLKLPSRFKKAS